MSVVKILDNQSAGESSIYSSIQPSRLRLLKIYASAFDSDWGGASVQLEAKFEGQSDDQFTPTGEQDIFSQDTVTKMEYTLGLEYRLSFITEGNALTAYIFE